MSQGNTQLSSWDKHLSFVLIVLFSYIIVLIVLFSCIVVHLKLLSGFYSLHGGFLCLFLCLHSCACLCVFACV